MSILNVTKVIANYDVSGADDVIICEADGSFTVTLPAAVVGRLLTFKNMGTGAVVIACQTGESVDGATTVQLGYWELLRMLCISEEGWTLV
ncbi:MAG: hypothetical protein A2Y38_04150 [Spirochaetes bacterium GWB1_59_5]|nr:MAG: hypothetical protein A2Y38_04150 [Spirochaetes bacterium GWB1_59_5]